MSSLTVTPVQLASALAARLVHDAVGPASGIVSAFDLIADPAAASMRDEALALATTSARELVRLLELNRVIFGGGGALSSAELRSMAMGMSVGFRATLDVAIADEPSPLGTRLLLGLVQIALGVVAAGGAVVARLDRSEQGERVEITARGPRPRLFDETLDGLQGRALTVGLPHRWSAAYFIAALARSAGGGVQVTRDEAGFVFRADITPAVA